MSFDSSIDAFPLRALFFFPPFYPTGKDFPLSAGFIEELTAGSKSSILTVVSTLSFHCREAIQTITYVYPLLEAIYPSRLMSHSFGPT